MAAESSGCTMPSSKAANPTWNSTGYCTSEGCDSALALPAAAVVYRWYGYLAGVATAATSVISMSLATASRLLCSTKHAAWPITKTATPATTSALVASMTVSDSENPAGGTAGSNGGRG